MSDFIKENEMSFDDLLGSNEKKKEKAPKKKKSAKIHPVSDEVQVEIDNLLKAKKDKKVADSNIKKSEPKVIEAGIKMKDDNAYSGKYQKSYKIGNDDSHVNVVTANKWSFQESDVELIKEIIEDADGNPDEMLEKKQTVQLKGDVFKDAELKKRFVEMVGKDFPEFFETVVSHKVAEDFDEQIYELGIGAVEDLKTYMKQSKPSVR